MLSPPTQLGHARAQLFWTPLTRGPGKCVIACHGLPYSSSGF